MRKVARKPQESWERRVPHSGTPALGALTICTEISVKIFRQMVLVFFLAPKTGTGLSCTIYKIQVNFSLSLDLKPGTGNPNKWYRKFRSFGKNEKRYYLERYYFFPENFRRNEPFHLNSPRNYRVCHTNDNQVIGQFWQLTSTTSIGPTTGRQRETIGLISKTTTLHVHRSIFGHCFTVFERLQLDNA